MQTANRWVIAVAAVIMQICLGAVYGWSVFVKPLVAAENWKLTDVSLNFTVALVFLGFGTVIGGLWLDRVGPRKVATVAGILYGIGYLVAGYAVAQHSLYEMYLGYGLITGIGMGMGYICPVATLVKWFPDMRGLMTGVAVCGYGFGALIMSPFAAWAITHHGLPATFSTLGVVYLIVVVVTAQFYAKPPAPWTSPSAKPWAPGSSIFFSCSCSSTFPRAS
jgi:OFA family oxalate/formate antiporter-like MFS transporter